MPFPEMWEDLKGKNQVRGNNELKYSHREVLGKEMWQGADAQPRSTGASSNCQAAMHYAPPEIKNLCHYAAVTSICAGVDHK